MRYLFVFIWILLSFSTYAQRDNFETFDDYILIKTSLHNSSLNLSLSPRKNGVTNFFKPIWYRPSVQNIMGFGVSFKGLSLSYNFKLRQNAKINARQGTSAFSNLQIHSFGKKLGFDVYFQNYQGYFIENFNNFVSSLFSGDQLQQRDDLRLKNISANVFYIFKPEKFSYRSAFGFHERQLKSGGSFILTGSLGYFDAKADSSFIPSDTEIEFHPDAFFNRADFYTFAVSPGYGYHIAFPRGFYATLGVSGMLGLQYHEAYTETGADKGFNYFLKGIARASVGYHVRKWVAGISLSTDIQGMNTKFVQLRSNNLDISVFLAHRIKTRWMKGKKSFFDFLKKKKKNQEVE